MNLTKNQTLAAPQPEPFRYESRYEFLNYNSGILRYTDDFLTTDIRLDEFFLPPTPPQPWTTTLADHPHYVESLIAFLDLNIDAGALTRPSSHSISKLCTFFREVIDWLRMHGIYHLKDARQTDIMTLAKEVAQLGWRGALKYDERWEKAVSSMTKDELKEGFYFIGGENNKLQGLRTDFWSRILGWNSWHLIPTSAKQLIESHFEQSSTWRRRKDPPSKGLSTQTTSFLLTKLNRLACLPADVDRLIAPTFSDVFSTARKIASRDSAATENLALEDAVLILSGAVTILYDLAPLLLDVLAEIKLIRGKIPEKDFSAYIFDLPATAKIEALIGWRIGEFNFKGPANMTDLEANGATCLDRIIGMVQSACAVAIGGLTAHRSKEIVNRHTGLRVGDLHFGSPEDTFAILDIYFSKSYKRRIPIQVCRMVMDAVLCLEKLKDLCLPSKSKPLEVGEDLFATHTPSRSRLRSKSSLAVYTFGVNNAQCRSLGFFLDFCFREKTEVPNFSPRMLRRFYSTLFMNRYRHPEIKVLQHVLGHLFVSNTIGYGFDKPKVRPDQRIEERLGVRNSQEGYDALELKALGEHFLQIQKENALIAKERLYENIEKILVDGGVAGGFSKLVSRLHAHLLLNSDFAELAPSAQVKEISDLAYAKGYRTEPMFHGECHAKSSADQNYRAQCNKDGELRKEYSGPILCSKCFFHFVDDAYVNNLSEMLTALKSDADDFLLSPLQQHQARNDALLLEHVIALHKQIIEQSRTHVVSFLKRNPK